MKIEDVEMITRTYNLLKLNGINNMKDLSEISKDEIIRWRNLGRRMLEEILGLMKNYNIDFK